MIKKPKWATSPKSLDLKTPDHRVIVSLLVFLLIISAIVLFNPNNSKVSTIKSYPAINISLAFIKNFSTTDSSFQKLTS
jgi:hypothetical protein